MDQNKLFETLTLSITNKLFELFNSSVISINAKGININLDSASEFIEQKIVEIDNVPDEDYTYKESLKLSAYYFVEAIIAKIEEDQFDEVLDFANEDNN